MFKENKYSKHRNYLKGVWFSLFICLVISYFVYHIFQGERGFLAYVKIQKTLATNTQELENLQKQCESLEKKVALMRPDGLCQDILEERARFVLNYANPHEVIIIDD